MCVRACVYSYSYTVFCPDKSIHRYHHYHHRHDHHHNSEAHGSKPKCCLQTDGRKGRPPKLEGRREGCNLYEAWTCMCVYSWPILHIRTHISLALYIYKATTYVQKCIYQFRGLCIYCINIKSLLHLLIVTMRYRDNFRPCKMVLT